jgi:pectate lyase C
VTATAGTAPAGGPATTAGRPSATGVAGSLVAPSGGSSGASAGSSAIPAAGSGALAAAGNGGSSGTVAAGTGASGQSGSPAAGTVAAGSGATVAGSGGSGGKAGSQSGAAGAPGVGGVVNQTIVVAAGQTFDGGGKRYTAGSALGDGSQDEDQKPIFKLEDGATLTNVVLGSPAADGIHCYGDVTLRNIVWEDIGEDAMTIKASGTVVLDGGSASNGSDKVFQINAASTFRVSNFKASKAGKFIRQNGDTTFKVSVFIDKCDISNMDEAIFRTDSSTSTVEMTNTRYSNIGDQLFIGVSAGNIKQSNNTEY